MIRTVVQISNSPNDVAALCNDGSIWIFDGNWRRLPDVPGRTRRKSHSTPRGKEEVQAPGWHGQTFVLPTGENL